MIKGDAAFSLAVTDGSFHTLRNIPIGDYTIRINAVDEGYVATERNIGTFKITATPPPPVQRPVKQVNINQATAAVVTNGSFTVRAAVDYATTPPVSDGKIQVSVEGNNGYIELAGLTNGKTDSGTFSVLGKKATPGSSTVTVTVAAQEDPTKKAVFTVNVTQGNIMVNDDYLVQQGTNSIQLTASGSLGGAQTGQGT